MVDNITNTADGSESNADVGDALISVMYYPPYGTENTTEFCGRQGEMADYCLEYFYMAGHGVLIQTK